MKKETDYVRLELWLNQAKIPFTTTKYISSTYGDGPNVMRSDEFAVVLSWQKGQGSDAETAFIFFDDGRFSRHWPMSHS